MIYLIAGRPRSGKSYESVKYHVIPALKSGRKVITNLPLNIPHIKKMLGDDVEQLITVVDFDYSDFDSAAVTFPFSKPDHYLDEWRDAKGVGPLYVIDEAHFSLPKGGTDKSVKKFYTMHGHYGVDILLMTQNARQLDADILNLVEIVYRTIKNTALGSTKTYTKKVQDGWRGDVVNIEQRKYDAEIFPYYKSHTQSSGEVLEREASDIKPIWKHWSVIGSCLLLPIGIIWLIYSLMTFNDDEPLPTENVSIDSPATDAQLPGQLPSELLPGQDSEPDLVGSPLADFKLYVKGWARQMFIYDDGDEYDPDANFYQVYIAAVKDGQEQFTIKSSELADMGYTLTALSDCVYSLSYGDETAFITCQSNDERMPRSALSALPTVRL